MTDELKVYLDHLIERENLRYQRSDEQMTEYPQDKQTTLRLADLTEARGKYLRKPDFQRATWAWTPEDCVSLLESVVKRQVIPSVIMWTSPKNGYDYILDGGHRVSVVLAWLNDDRGEKHANQYIEDESERDSIHEAAKRVRQLVQAKIGNIRDYKEAEKQLERVVIERRSPADVLDEQTFNRGLFYQSLRKGDIYFHILWVRGDFRTAEESFLKINKSGRQLSDWEKTLVENRNSSFARAVMSISGGSSAPHYWPEYGSEDKQHLADVQEILSGVTYLQNILFQPYYETPIQQLQQPFLVASKFDRPRYVAELLTITEGFRGQEPETQKLLGQDKNATPEEIISSGLSLVSTAVDVFYHLNGPSSQPKSLALVPVLYFYNDSGRYVRSLLYGFIYWLVSGEANEILDRKRLFCAYRGPFEYIVRFDKSEIIRKISRMTGSGPEVTVQTARYYQGLLQLLISHNGDIFSQQFTEEYDGLTDRLTLTDRRRSSSSGSSSSGRNFTEKQKSATILDHLLDTQLKCDICEGMLDPTGNLQHDHITEFSRGGRTHVENQRLVHPFCNHQRTAIEQYRQGIKQINLPPFADPGVPGGPRQLALFPDSAFQ